MIDSLQLMRAPYLHGGRDFNGIDCLGVVLMITEARGRPIGDPWKTIEAQWNAGSVDCSSGFPPSWRRVYDKPIEGDVMVFDGVHPWTAVVDDGHVWSSNEPAGGAYRKPLCNWRLAPRELWRHETC